MSAKSIYLAGSPPNETSSSIDVSRVKTLDELRYGVAKFFSIADSKSLSFHGESGVLSTMDEIRQTTTKIGVRVDSQIIREPLSPPEIPIVGNYFEIYSDHIGNHDRLFRRYGSVIKTVNMGTTVYFTNDPRVSEIVLGENEFFTKTTSNSNHPLFWMNNNMALFTCDTAAPAFKLAHRFVPPSMSTKATKHYVPTLQRAVEASFAVFDELDERQQAWHTYQYMFKLGGQIVCKVVLGQDVGHFDTVDTHPHEIIRLMGEYLALMKQTSLSPPWFKYLPFSSLRRLYIVEERLWALIDQVAAAWPLPDAPDLPIAQAALESTCIADYLKRATDDSGQKLPHNYLLSNIVSILGAGLTTSSSMLSLLLYAITKYPGMQERILQELIDHDVTQDTQWTHDNLMNLPFLNRFVKETLRLHGPAFQTARNAKKNVIVPGGWLIPADSVVIPTFPSIHRHQDYWDNPDRFDPDRWLAKDVKKHRLAYTPFAAGPRGCVGFNIVHVEARLVLALLVLRYEICDVSKEPMMYDPEFLVVRPINSYVRASRRTSWPDKGA
ncbi:uncharacterized protein N7479_002205 [Penicillium vulpinum]|uniref:Cytochrome P450 monooxygenase n=1 Tax=Penicillium vulpinum TaxID=29845 RepID=A0A1V6S864_9EURO|nr:uncharacterized protein N7479_002205 [Penicillium vulpinum]KAJ5972287.1 hypothetical protein N7479_002205 [Penicillium vulpinum]OQE09909.1 hypothetical protein PENVUL_c005G07406 [Penicillium vulpinum]